MPALRGFLQENADSFIAAWVRGSSDVDWCEENYARSAYVAEFYNTISNIPFLILPPLQIYLFRNYARRIDPQVNIVWALLIVVGFFSGLFHATLSFSGQLFDEISILWVLMAALALWAPPEWISRFGTRERFKQFMVAVAIINTPLSVVYPVANAFVLMCVAVPCIQLIFSQVMRSDDTTAWRLAGASITWWFLALTCWIQDRAFCLIWKSFDFPYPQLHSWWHVLILIASYTACVLGAYFYALDVAPHLMPRLSYWPRRTWEFGVPYVELCADIESGKGD